MHINNSLLLTAIKLETRLSILRIKSYLLFNSMDYCL
jgi:hypothetical protein